MTSQKWRSISCLFFLVLSKSIAKPTYPTLNSELNKPQLNLTTPSEDSDPVNATLDGMIQVDDMMLTPEQYLELQVSQNIRRKPVKDQLLLTRKKHKAVRSPKRLWSNGTIPYRIGKGLINAADLIRQAMGVWQQYTCLTFRESLYEDKSYTYIYDDKVCYSSVGCSYENKISLGVKCQVTGIILHELGHTIGLYHEQTRPDRDDHVEILVKNIQAIYHRLFQNYSWGDINTYNISYDYTSIMHYGPSQFTKNGLPTIRTKDANYQSTIGQRTGLSFSDVKIVNLMYTCGRHCPAMDCPADGFVGKDCRCWCKGKPVELCEVSNITDKMTRS